MRIGGNTVLVTGGGTGIGRGLAEAFHRAGSQVIVAGRREGPLADVAAANPGMRRVRLDVGDPASLAVVIPDLLREFPGLNVVLNAAGIASRDDLSGPVDDAVLADTVAVNLVGAVRLTSALVEHFKRQEGAAIVHVSSMLAYLPFAQTAVYSATKAALHSYLLSLRYRLAGTGVAVVEIMPPLVATALTGNDADPRAMPLAEFVAETMAVLATDAPEVLVGRAHARRDDFQAGQIGATARFNDLFAAGQAAAAQPAS